MTTTSVGLGRAAATSRRSGTPSPTRARALRRSSGSTAVRFIVALIATCVFIGPVMWMVLTAFKTGNQAFSTNPVLVFTPTMDNYRSVMFDSGFGTALVTSIRVSGTSTIAALLLGSGVAYPLARFPFRGDRQLANFIISLRVIPPIVTIIPLFLMFRTVGLTGSLGALILVHTFMNLPLAVWLLRGFYADVPKEIEEAARVDGLGHGRTFFRIVLPLAAPGVVATALLCFLFSWNEFLFANILAGAGNRTVTVGLTEFVTPVGTEWTRIMAAGTIVVLPVWIAALCAQKYLVRGLTLGAVK